MDTLYIGYNLEMAREFIGDCAFWARHLHGLALEVEEFVFKDKDGGGDHDIQAFRIRFASGFEIVALSSRPRSLRGKQGFVIIDEAAFHDDLPELLKAALALLVWGGRVWIISTHNGEDNPFNELVQDVRAGRKPYKLMRTTFDDALEEGLYRRICLVRGLEWTPEGEAKWAADIRAFYGDDAAEELDCVPSRGAGVYLPRALIEACMNSEYGVLRLACPEGFETKPDAERESFVQAWIEETLDPAIAALNPDLRSYFGEDFGRSGDLTVIWPLQEDTNLVRRSPFVVELHNVPFRQQEQVLFHLVDRLPRFMAGAMDARGNGQFLAEVAMQRYGATRIEQVMLSNQWYLDNMPRLKSAFEDQTIEIPRDADVLADLRAVRMEKGIAKVPEDARSRGSDGRQRHGDAAIALALAYHASELDVAPIEFQSAGPRSLTRDAGDFLGVERGAAPVFHDFMG
jgi:phage FluMu gp28-like protein